MTRPQLDDRSWKLVDAALNESMSDADRAALESRLAKDPEAAQLYADYCLLHADLHLANVADRAIEATRAAIVGENVERKASAVSDQPSAEEETAPSSATHRSPLTTHPVRTFVRSHNFAVAVAVAFVSVASVLGWMAFSYVPHTAEVDDATDTDAQEKVVAWLMASVDTTWLEDTKPAGTRLAQGQRLAISRGLVELQFRSGAEVVIEGPAEFVIGGTKAEGTKAQSKDKEEAARSSSPHPSPLTPQSSSNSGFLSLGRLVARCNTPESKGFTIFTPVGNVEDLGTEFGVELIEGQRARVVVYEGEVRVAQDFGDGSARKTRLVAGSIATLTHGGLLEVTNTIENAPNFVRSVPRPDALNDGPLSGVVDEVLTHAKPFDLTTLGGMDWAYWDESPETSDGSPTNRRKDGDLIGNITPVGGTGLRGSNVETRPKPTFEFSNGTSKQFGSVFNPSGLFNKALEVEGAGVSLKIDLPTIDAHVVRLWTAAHKGAAEFRASLPGSAVYVDTSLASSTNDEKRTALHTLRVKPEKAGDALTVQVTLAQGSAKNENSHVLIVAAAVSLEAIAKPQGSRSKRSVHGAKGKGSSENLQRRSDDLQFPSTFETNSR
ncbi:MAG: FecR family protein [Pirellulales bacterium]|nr:FecR family protein [Pirellulales bacterium]